MALHDNDDGASAGVIDAAVESAGIPPSKILRTSSPNVGFGAAHNRLQEAAYAAHPEADGYLCLNPDGMLHPLCVARLQVAAQARSWRGLFEAAQFPVPHPKVYDARTGATAWCSGCCLLIPRLVWENVGPFDPRFFMYCEDVDLSWRVKAWGGGCYTVPDALIHHYLGDRDESRSVHPLLSAALLAHKWGADDFAVSMLRELHGRTGIGYDEMPLEGERVAPQDAARAGADFTRGLTFSPAFW